MEAQIADDTKAELWDDSVVISQGEDLVVLTFAMLPLLRIALEAFERKLEDKP